MKKDIYDFWFISINYLHWSGDSRVFTSKTKYDDWENADEVKMLLGGDFVQYIKNEPFKKNLVHIMI